MKLPKLNKYDIVKVTWTDTHIPKEAGWMSESKHKEWVDSSGSSVLSVGIYVSQDKHFIHLIGDMDADAVLEKEVLRPINIAKNFITSIKVLK